MTQSFDEIRSYLGRRVRVTLTDIRETPASIAEGIFLGIGDGGDFEILEDDGFVHYCWPLLNIEDLGE